MRIRDFQGIDFDPMAKVLGELWHTAHGDHAFWQGADELCDHLAQTDKGFVAIHDNGDLAGFILLQSADAGDRNDTLRMHWLQQRTRLAAMATALGVDSRADVAYLNEENHLLEQAAEELGSDGVGTVVLLVVLADTRGGGLGRKLLQTGFAWLSEHGAHTARLVTDEACDWPFYEHLGMTRVMAVASAVGDEPIQKFIYQTGL